MTSRSAISPTASLTADLSVSSAAVDIGLGASGTTGPVRASDLLPPVASLDSLPFQLNTVNTFERVRPVTTRTRSVLPRPEGHIKRFNTTPLAGDHREPAQ